MKKWVISLVIEYTPRVEMGWSARKWLIFCTFCWWQQKNSLGKVSKCMWSISFSFGFSATIRNLLAIEQTGFWCFCYTQYLTNGNSEAYEQYHFLKKTNNIFQAQFNIFPKLRLVFCFHHQKTQKLRHFWHSSDHNPRSKHNS